MADARTAPAVVVGIDGSATALRAALWAVDVASGRDAPLRLVYALDGAGGPAPDDTAAHATAAARRAADDVTNAVRATGKPVTIDVDIAQGAPSAVLVRASRSAAMVCVGAIGSHHFQPGRMGSTAAALAVSAHCPVAVIRGQPARQPGRVILAEVDESPDNGIVLEAAVEQARLRSAPLRVIACWQAPYEDQRANDEGDRQIRARLARRLAPWQRRHPDLQMEPIAVHGSVLGYLTRNAAAAQLFIMGAGSPDHVAEVVGPAGTAALSDSGCAILIVNRRHL